MALKSTIRIATLAAFNAADDLIDTAIYSYVGAASYNSTTGASTQTDTDITGLKFLRSEYKAIELTESIKETDFKGFMLYSELSAITPKIGDFITVNSTEYTIKNWKNIYDILWEFQLRPKNV